MNIDYVDSPRLIWNQYIPLGSWATVHEDLETRAGRQRELRTDMISRLRAGDRVRTTSIRAFCDGPQELADLVREIVASHLAAIEFVAEHITVTPDDVNLLPKILESLFALDPWNAPTSIFPPEVTAAAIDAAESTRRLQQRAYKRMPRASEKGAGQ